MDCDFGWLLCVSFMGQSEFVEWDFSGRFLRSLSRSVKQTSKNQKRRRCKTGSVDRKKKNLQLRRVQKNSGGGHEDEASGQKSGGSGGGAA